MVNWELGIAGAGAGRLQMTDFRWQIAEATGTRQNEKGGHEARPYDHRRSETAATGKSRRTGERVRRYKSKRGSRIASPLVLLRDLELRSGFSPSP